MELTTLPKAELIKKLHQYKATVKLGYVSKAYKLNAAELIEALTTELKKRGEH